MCVFVFVCVCVCVCVCVRARVFVCVDTTGKMREVADGVTPVNPKFRSGLLALTCSLAWPANTTRDSFFVGNAMLVILFKPRLIVALHLVQILAVCGILQFVCFIPSVLS